MLHKGNAEYLTLQSNIICLLLFFVSVLLITHQPAWFGKLRLLLSTRPQHQSQTW